MLQGPERSSWTIWTQALDVWMCLVQIHLVQSLDWNFKLYKAYNKAMFNWPQAGSCKGNKWMESEAKRQECRTSQCSQCQTKSRATEEGSWAEATRGKKLSNLKVWRIFWVTPFSVVYLQAEAKLRKEKEQKEKEETKYQISSLLLLLAPFRAFGDSSVLFVLPFGLLGNQIVHLIESGWRCLASGSCQKASCLYGRGRRFDDLIASGLRESFLLDTDGFVAKFDALHPRWIA